MAASLTGNFCTPEQVQAAKAAGTVLDCAFENPTLGEGYCGNETRAFCEIEAGTGTGAGNASFDFYKLSDGTDMGAINSYKATNCLNAAEYGVEDHGSMKYDLNYNREARFYLTRQSTTCDPSTQDCTDTANYGTSLTNITVDGTDFTALQREIIGEKGIELFNDDDGGNFVTYFGAAAGGAGATESPTINNTFVHGIGAVGFGSQASPNASPTISMIDNTIQFENLNTCAMQPYGVTAVLYEFDDGVQASASGGTTSFGSGVEGNQVQVKNVTKTDDNNVTIDHPSMDSTTKVLAPAGSVHNTTGALGYVTFGTQAGDIDYTNATPSTSTLRSGGDLAAMDGALYSTFTIQKTGSGIVIEQTGVAPVPAINQPNVAYQAGQTDDVTTTVGSPDTTTATAVTEHQYDGCRKCSAHFYQDLSTGNFVYPAFHRDCTAANTFGAGTDAVFTTVAAPMADGVNTRDVAVCTAGADCPNFTSVSGAETFSAANFIDVVHTQGLCNMADLIENDNFYGGPDIFVR